MSEPAARGEVEQVARCIEEIGAKVDECLMTIVVGRGRPVRV